MLCRLIVTLMLVVLTTTATADLLVHYSFEGDVLDETGAYNGTAWGTAAYTAGKFGQAFDFSGDDYLTVGISNPAAVLVNEVTIAFWANMDISLNNQAKMVAGLHDDGSTRMVHPQFWYGTMYWDTSGDNRAQVAAPADISDGWHHWAFTKNAVTGKQIIYYDGQNVAESASATTPFTIAGVWSALAVGSHFGFSDWYTGLMDDFMMYDNELTQSEIQDIMNHSFARVISPVKDQVGVSAAASLQWKLPVRADVPTEGDPNVAAFVIFCDPNETVVRNATVDNHAGVDYYSDQALIGDPSTDPVQSYNPTPDLAVNTTYYWRVDTRLDTATEPNQVLTGYVWSFNTDLQPVITAQPADQLVFETTGVAVFEVTADDPSVGGLDYQWYLDPNPLGSGDETVIPGETAATLSISAPDAGDEGFYICQVSNSGGSVWTRSARLVLKRLVNYYPFDGNANDVVNGYNGVAVGAPAYVSGLIGTNAIELNGDDGISIAFDELYPTTAQEITVSAWVKASTIAGGSSIVKNWSDTLGGLIYFGIDGAGEHLQVLMGQATGGAVFVTEEDAVFPIGQWQFVAAVYDGTQVRLYRNGAEVAAAEYTGLLDVSVLNTAIGYTPGDDGNPSVENPNYWDGTIDDVRIYNYGLSLEDIAQGYYDVTNIANCLYPPAYDLTNDCRVTLDDFAKIASEWLVCGLYPVAGCP